MHYLDKKEIAGLQQYFKDLEIENHTREFGNNKLIQQNNTEEFDNKNVTTKISIDFFLNELKIYLVIPQKEIKIEILQDESGKEKEIKKTEITKRNKLIIKSVFEIAQDFKSVNAAGKTYIIDDYFNEAAVKNSDEKTWQLIFYSMFREEILKELNK